MKYNQLIIGFLLLFTLQFYSQGNVPPRVFISENKLDYIVILQNNRFGFISYDKDSPYLVRQKTSDDLISGGCGTRGFALKSSGFGIYAMDGDLLKLTFTKPETMIDSVKINYLATKKFENPVNVTFVPHYNFRSLGMSEVEITDLENRLIANVYQNNLSPNIGYGRFPLKLIINREKEIELIEPKNQEINIYINSFETYSIIPMTTKHYSIKTLTDITNE